MKDVTERLEGEAPTRRVFQQQLFMTLAVSTVLCSVQAAPQGPEALGSKLTPLGGEIAASASGDIPAWTQPGQQDEGWSYGQVRGEHWKFKGDKPLYSIAPQSRRYELHRVWVVEANVRQGMRHQAPKRMFYIDEDSWNPLLAVDYDKQGQIWKVREGFSIPVYETGACDVQAQVQYNLADGRYLFDMTSIGAGKNDIRWLTEDNGSPRLKRDFFTSDNLRAISER
ncbi:DUF1329 domain-containing protein [Pseudomonas aeruginosa]|nr:DUF1329 domain-containing protein [Pseudomonas aeruginosa]